MKRSQTASNGKDHKVDLEDINYSSLLCYLTFHIRKHEQTDLHFGIDRLSSFVASQLLSLVALSTHTSPVVASKTSLSRCGGSSSLVSSFPSTRNIFSKCSPSFCDHVNSYPRRGSLNMLRRVVHSDYCTKVLQSILGCHQQVGSKKRYTCRKFGQHVHHCGSNTSETATIVVLEVA